MYLDNEYVIKEITKSISQKINFTRDLFAQTAYTKFIAEHSTFLHGMFIQNQIFCVSGTCIS